MDTHCPLPSHSCRSVCRQSSLPLPVVSHKGGCWGAVPLLLPTHSMPVTSPPPSPPPSHNRCYVSSATGLNCVPQCCPDCLQERHTAQVGCQCAPVVVADGGSGWAACKDVGLGSAGDNAEALALPAQASFHPQRRAAEPPYARCRWGRQGLSMALLANWYIAAWSSASRRAAVGASAALQMLPKSCGRWPGTRLR